MGDSTGRLCATDEAAARQWLANIGWRSDSIEIDMPSLGIARESEYYAVCALQ